MRFYSKFVFVCNIAFLLSVVMRFVEFGSKNAASSNEALGFQPLQSTLIILGYGAVLFNFGFLFLWSLKKIFKKELNVPLWIFIANFFFFVLQILYFFN